MNEPTKPGRVVKRFLVQVEGDDTTRWLLNDEGFRLRLELISRPMVYAATGGAVPSVTVSIQSCQKYNPVVPEGGA